jgi:hypothetical protein
MRWRWGLPSAKLSLTQRNFFLIGRPETLFLQAQIRSDFAHEKKALASQSLLSLPLLKYCAVPTPLLRSFFSRLSPKADNPNPSSSIKIVDATRYFITKQLLHHSKTTSS